MPVDWVTQGTRPGDHPSWAQAFRHIETNHVTFAPNHWGNFVADITRRGVRTPIIILDNGTTHTVLSGHHRVWAAAKVNLDTVPAIITTDPDLANRLLNEQADHETDWAQ